ncbi:MAG: hypothetical protein R3F55_22340 [Alphaproteobacteria bacterium]
MLTQSPDLATGLCAVAGLAQRQDPRERAVEVDPKLAALRLQLHLLHQRADLLHRLMALRRIGQRLVQRGHLLPVDLGQVGMQPGQWRPGLIEFGLEGLLALLQVAHAGVEHAGVAAGEYRVDQPLQLPVDAGDLAAHRFLLGVGVAAQPVELGVELADEHLEQLGVHQPGLEPVEDGRLQRVAADVEAVGAGALVAGAGAAEQALADLDVAAAADPALHQPGEQEARPAPLPRRPLGVADCCLRAQGDRLLARPDRVPQRLRHDPEVRLVADHPLLGRVQPRDAPTGVGVLIRL